jgi:heme-degrading monooxygenase HmoA
MIYEFRSYQAAPGRLGDLDERFRDLTTKVFARLGFTPFGFWTASDPDRVVYLLAWRDDEERAAKWAEFGADPEWLAGKAASEENGPLVAGITTEAWRPASYSALGPGAVR